MDVNANNGSDRYVVGVDFGTVSGRAVVVRVPDGRERGSAVHGYANAVIGDVLPASGKPLPPDRPPQDPDVHLPNERRAGAHEPLYAAYRTLHDDLGRGPNDVLHRPRRIRNAAYAEPSHGRAERSAV